MSPLLVSLAAALVHLAGAFYLIRRLFNQQPPDRKIFSALAILACLLQAGGLYSGLFSAQGLVLDFFNAASLITLFVVVSLVVCMRCLAVNLMLAPFHILAALSIICGLLVGTGHSQPIAESPGVLAHILLSILAYGTLSIAVLQSLILLLQDQQLRKRPVSAWVRSFPPLQSMEALLFSMIWSGWLLLGLSLITGWLYLDDLFARQVAHKTLFSCLAWLVFAVLLWGRHQLGWRGHKAIRLTLAGFSLLMLAYFGSKLVREFILIA